MKRGKNDRLTPLVVRAVADHEGGFSVDGDQRPERLFPGEVRGVGLQDVLVRFGAESEHIAVLAVADLGHRSVRSGEFEQRSVGLVLQRSTEPELLP